MLLSFLLSISQINLKYPIGASYVTVNNSSGFTNTSNTRTNLHCNCDCNDVASNKDSNTKQDSQKDRNVPSTKLHNTKATRPFPGEWGSDEDAKR